jgi:HSP20 family protein
MAIKDMISRKRENGNTYRIVSPMVNIQEKETEIIVQAEMPGIVKEDLRIEVHGDELTIGAKRHNDVPKEYTAYIQERMPVEYKRVFTLGNQIDKNEVKARYEHGLLIITLQKSESAQPRKIAIE